MYISNMSESVYDDDEHRPEEWDGDKPVDSNGREYNPYQGSKTPSDGRCNALLTNYEERYGEKRYCMRLPLDYFNDSGVEVCNVHKGFQGLMEHSKEILKHGVFASNYATLFDNMDTLEQIEAIQIFDNLIAQSEVEFDIKRETVEFDVSETPLSEVVGNDEGVIEEEVPFPESSTLEIKSLWAATLDLMKMDRINTIQLEDGMEREKIVGITDEGETKTNLDEHHLHLPYSRLTKDVEKHLERGGVVEGDTDSGSTVNTGVFVRDPTKIEGNSIDEPEKNPMSNIDSEE